jgi:hypothetical protein
MWALRVLKYFGLSTIEDAVRKKPVRKFRFRRLYHSKDIQKMTEEFAGLAYQGRDARPTGTISQEECVVANGTSHLSLSVIAFPETTGKQLVAEIV